MVPTAWYVGFVKAPPKHWFDYIRPFARYRHCFAFGFDGVHDRWLMVDFQVRGTTITILEGHELDDLIVRLKMNGEILQARPFKRKHVFPRLAVSYCVAGVAQVVNLPGNPITPDGLFRALRKNGGRVAFDGVKQALADNKD